MWKPKNKIKNLKIYMMGKIHENENYIYMFCMLTLSG